MASTKTKPRVATHSQSMMRMAAVALLGMILMVAVLAFLTSNGTITPHTMVEQERTAYAASMSDESITDEPFLPPELRQAQMRREFAMSLAHYTQQTTTPRGVVLPLFDHIAHLGTSMILELRALGVDLPIEVPHCGDLKPEFQRMVLRDPLVRVYDVCEQALAATNLLGDQRKLFCNSDRECRGRFQSFYIKIIAVAFSQFEEIMLMDADTVYFQKPMHVWNTTQFQQTGTLFFHDRISSAGMFLDTHVANASDGRPVKALHEYLSGFDVSPYRTLARIPRAAPTVENAMAVQLGFLPSDTLLASHSWNMRAGHEMDSSLVLWSKTRQPRATAILASFLALDGVPLPPSYGEKEMFFIACELAETQYAFSDFGVGTVSTDLRAYDGVPNSMLCGIGVLHYFPQSTGATHANPAPLYLNSDDIMDLDTSKDNLYRSVARPAAFYPGSLVEKKLAQECAAFGIKAQLLTASEKKLLASRQQHHKTVLSWGIK